MGGDDSNRRRWTAWRPGQLARNGVVVLGWMLLRAAAQAATIILLARGLAAPAYGEFVATIAIAGFVAPLVGLGLASMVLRNVARDSQAAAWYLGRAIRVWIWTLLPAIIIALGLALLLLPKGTPIIAMAAAISGELLATSLTELAGRFRQAQHRPHSYGAINAGLPWLRLLTLGVLMLATPSVGISAVLWVYAAASISYLFVLWPVVRDANSGEVKAREPMAITSGLPFSATTLATRLQGEFNKPILAQAGLGLAGTYNIAQRAVDMASLPLLAMLEALWPRLYAQPDPMPQLRRTGLALIIMALGLGVALWFSAPLLIYLVGSDYEKAAGVVKFLALLPALQVARSLITSHSIHRGWMRNIGLTSAFGGVLSVVSVAVLVPAFELKGAVFASYVTELGMTVVLLVLAFRSNRSSFRAKE